MPSGRGVAVFVAGLAMWLARAVVGSPGMEVVAHRPWRRCRSSPALFVRWGRQRLAVRRRLSDVRVAPGRGSPSTRRGERRSAPRPRSCWSRTACPPRSDARRASSSRASRPTARGGVTYTVVPQTRGRYRFGPLTVDVVRPVRAPRSAGVRRARGAARHAGDRGPTGRRTRPRAELGSSRARQLFRTGEEYYTMRQYQEGDDLRRIHWPASPGPAS